MTVIGVPAESKNGERRVALIPDAVGAIVRSGASVVVERGAGCGAGFEDAEYALAGAELVGSASEVWKADLVVKVKEPQPQEYLHFRPGMRLFAYLHLAAEAELARALLRSCVEAHAFETVVDRAGRLPLLAPMSEVAGRAATIVGANVLAEACGVLVGGAAGVPPAKVVVLGLGVSGTVAARTARGLDAEVLGVDVDLGRLRDAQADGTVSATLASIPDAVGKEVAEADLVIGAALVPGARAPVVLLEEHVANMRPGSVIVDLAIDQGGCVETSRATSHANPTYEIHGVTHYCVTNVPGRYPRTASRALSAAIAPYVVRLAAAPDGHSLEGSLNVADGQLAHPVIAAALAADLVEE